MKNNEFTFDPTWVEVGIVFLIIMYVISFALTIGPICWIYLAEIMTEKGMGIAVSLNWLIVIFISYLPSLAKTNDPDKRDSEKDLTPFFFVFSGFCIMGFFLISLFVKETFGLTLLEIRTLYKNEEYDPLKEESMVYTFKKNQAPEVSEPESEGNSGTSQSIQGQI